ncbi:MAG: M28 family peptidase [Flavobacteriales bacterium]|nr:M28 family peptidase [Flavobacteriales bacterium]
MRLHPSLFLLSFSVLSASFANAQWMGDEDARTQMRYDVQYLASDELEGREAGTKGEKLAADYIMGKFQNAGLVPYGDSVSYLQKFPFAAMPVLGAKNSLQVGRKQFKQGQDWFPMAYCDTGIVFSKLVKAGYGIEATQLGRNDYEGIDVKDRVAAISISSPDGVHPHSRYIEHNDLRKRAELAISKGAIAVLFYNDNKDTESPEFRMSEKVQALSVPVLFLKGDLHEGLIVDGNPIVISTDIVREQRTGMNVVGFLDNGKENVVVIGAHFDHLGYGDEGSLHRGERAIHNGADDNASGIAVMLQLARDLRELDEARANDYLFIAFSGEEKGLYGSNWWTKHPTVPIEKLTYMINLDMVGRLDSSKTIAISGVGTSPSWAEIDPMKINGLKAKTSKSGIGPSDHTSFYLKDVPAIHFFTGSHGDYHKPGDDVEKVNFNGMLDITRFIESLITSLNDDPKLTFTKTQEADSTETPRFKVTMGVVPDYMYDGKGLRVDGVTEGKPGAAAGVKANDIVVKLGSQDVTDMMSYMKALGFFNKGETTQVTVLREGKPVTMDITFK